ncbi:MAG: Methyltransferase [Labilithrix sp.]|nr:Methyltransferase [Labilithrix sp.]
MNAPGLSDVARLAPKVVELSRAYNTAQAEGRRTRLPLEARIAFSFPRDVPKGAGAVRELVASGVVAIPADRPLRVLDLGAGLGAMTWGLVRALAAGGARGRVEALLVDEDEAVLAKALAIGRAARSALGSEPIELVLETRTQSLPSGGDRVPPGGPWDVVLLGQVLSEIDPRSEAGARLEAQAALVERLLAETVAPDGALVIVEPALRERTRHLHALRDRILEKNTGSVNVFAPCLHRAACPMLALETEWCHEDLAVDLPPWTVPLARAAGLRWQGLTFSYLVLRRDGQRVTGATRPAEAGSPLVEVRFRSVSDLLSSKGKAELFICGEDGTRRRIRRLDRDADAERGHPFGELHRGDIVTLSSAAPGLPIDERGRVQVGAHVAIDVAAARK